MSQVLGIARPRHERYPSPQPEIHGRHSSASFRSLTSFQGGAEDEGGAEIPDIPRRRLRISTAVTDNIAPPANFRKFSTANTKLSPMDYRTGDHRRPASAQSHVEHDAFMAQPEPEEPRDFETRSPSTGPRSILSRSTRSRANSSTSSLVPTHGSALPALQSKGPLDHDSLEPLAEEEIDPASFDLVAPTHGSSSQTSLETQSELLFSIDHLKVIFDDPLLLQRFASFLYASRPSSVPLLIYYLDALKALTAIRYANAISDGLVPIEGLRFSDETAVKTVNESLLDKANQAFEALAREDLPAYITYTWIQTVSLTVKRRIADTLPVHLRDLSEGLAETFCLTDPSRPDNPIVFASEEFHKTTQYGMGYVLGRNCRFLQGPKTNRNSVRRLREKLEAGKEHCETFLNYRRDGSPFMNLLMVAPLYDSRGVVRYHIGAQVDVSGLVKECAGLESFGRLVAQRFAGFESAEAGDEREKGEGRYNKEEAQEGGGGLSKKSEFCALAEMFNLQELKTVRQSGGVLYRTRQEEMGETEHGGANWQKPRLVIRDDAATERRKSDPTLHTATMSSVAGGRLSGVYEHYLLVRPHPSLRILFASPSLRVPGILQSSFLARIGGSQGVREAIEQAFADGNGVTAKVRWITGRGDVDSNGAGGKGRWIHCTPLLGANGAIGVWMVVLVDDETEAAHRRTRNAPPVEAHIDSSRRRQFDDDNMSLASFAAAANRVFDEMPAPPVPARIRPAKASYEDTEVD
ncbi:hypothetical protein F5X99DRAFT_397928 [Biscogniauxia marginata]|nr:hypothetical protein F5X99DRAFT_397928 [Biscogniauxia marginata]